MRRVYIPSLASSRSLGSVGFPFDETMAEDVKLVGGGACWRDRMIYCCEVVESASQRDA